MPVYGQLYCPGTGCDGSLYLLGEIAVYAAVEEQENGTKKEVPLLMLKR